MSPHDRVSEDERAAVGRSLRVVRTSRSLSLRDLAEALAVSPATLSAVENGKTGVSGERLADIARVLDVPVEMFFATDDEVGTWSSAVLAEPAPAWRDFPPLELEPALAGALSAFVEFGYHGATMRIIADRAGLSVPGLYHHHASKQDMLVALLDLTMDDLLGRTRAARDEGTDPVARFSLVVECLALFHTHYRELAFIGASEMRSLTPDNRRPLAALRVDQQRLVDAEVEAAVRSGDFRTHEPREAARAVVTMCIALAQWFRSPGPSTAETVATQYVRFALDVVQHVPR